jgi:hypothetical protein
MDGGLLLIFSAEHGGAAGHQLLVTQDEWRRLGSETYRVSVSTTSAPPKRPDVLR